MLGLKAGAVEVIPYQKEWVELFKEEQRALSKLLGAALLRVEHVGSTSIPGLSAKPILDIVAEVATLQTAQALIPLLTKAGYQHRPEVFPESRVYYVKGPESGRTHHLSFFPQDSLIFREHILFRDFLCANPEQAHQYEQLKKQLAAQFPDNRTAYTENKQSFIRNILQRCGT